MRACGLGFKIYGPGGVRACGDLRMYTLYYLSSTASIRRLIHANVDDEK